MSEECKPGYLVKATEDVSSLAGLTGIVLDETREWDRIIAWIHEKYGAGITPSRARPIELWVLWSDGLIRKNAKDRLELAPDPGPPDWRPDHTIPEDYFALNPAEGLQPGTVVQVKGDPSRAIGTVLDFSDFKTLDLLNEHRARKHYAPVGSVHRPYPHEAIVYWHTCDDLQFIDIARLTVMPPPEIPDWRPDHTIPEDYFALNPPEPASDTRGRRIERKPAPGTWLVGHRRVWDGDVWHGEPEMDPHRRLVGIVQDDGQANNKNLEAMWNSYRHREFKMNDWVPLPASKPDETLVLWEDGAMTWERWRNLGLYEYKAPEQPFDWRPNETIPEDYYASNPVQQNPTIARWRYVSPRQRALSPEESWVRDVAYGIKAGHPVAVAVAAEHLVEFVPPGAVLVPAPSSAAGGYGGVLALARRLAQLRAGTVRQLVRRTSTVPSSHVLRRAGGEGLEPEAHVASMGLSGRVPAGRPLVLVDNVITSGATLEAMRQVLGVNAPAVVWAGVIERANPDDQLPLFGGGAPAPSIPPLPQDPDWRKTTRVHKAVIYRHKACEKKTGRKVVWRVVYTVDVQRWKEQGKWGPETRSRVSWWVPGTKPFEGQLVQSSYQPSSLCPVCGRSVGGDAIKGTYSDKIRCGAKCLAAIGPSCECTCAGANHGASWGGGAVNPGEQLPLFGGAGEPPPSPSPSPEPDVEAELRALAGTWPSEPFPPPVGFEDPSRRCPSCGEPEVLDVFEVYPEDRTFQIETCCLYSYERWLSEMESWTPDQWRYFFASRAGVEVRSVGGAPEHREAKGVMPWDVFTLDFGITLVPSFKGTKLTARLKGELAPGTLLRDEIREYVRLHHEHADAPPAGYLWGYAVYNGTPTDPVYDGRPRFTQKGESRPTNLVSWPANLVGVAMVGRPSSAGQGAKDKGKPIGQTNADVTRVALDFRLPHFLTFKASSAIYLAAWEEACRRGYAACQTFTLASENGMSLRYARFKPVGTSAGGQADRPSRPRAARSEELAQPKIRWERKCKS